MTADNQKMNKADRELAHKIRKSVYADQSLSTYAHNVKSSSRTESDVEGSGATRC